jgi:glyoxylase-like metal-dependent hydrolase (beta-lactamase superfamily II)
MQLRHVQGDVYALTGMEANVTVQIGDQGILFVDTPPLALLEDSIKLVGSLTPKPIQFVITTHLGRNNMSSAQALIDLRLTPTDKANAQRMSLAAGGSRNGVKVLGREEVLNRISDRSVPAIPGAALTSEYFMPSMDFPMNGDGIVVYHEPNAITDGDSVVYFRRSDVVSAGAIVSPGRFPEIDLARGGSINGLIKATNHILEVMVPGLFEEGGTYLVPGYGRICDEADVAYYREMLTIVRDRVQVLIDQGKTLQDVQKARPALDYETTYGGARGGPTAQAFVETVFKSLMASRAEGKK